MVIGYNAATMKTDGEDGTPEHLGVTISGNTGIFPNKETLERFGDICTEEIDKIVHALLLEKENPKFPW